jgi:hydrogenase/urease accessory protein HupE
MPCLTAIIRASLIVLVSLVAMAPLRAHTFTTLTADLLSDGDDLSLTLGLHLLDAIAIIAGKPTSAGNTLTASQLRAGSDTIREYLEKHVRLRVNGELVAGKCLGYVPDLINPPKPGDPPAELLPQKVPFLLVWTLPKDARAVDIEFALLIDYVGSGVVHVNLHQGDRTQSHYTDLGGTVTVTLRGKPAPPKPTVVVSTPPTEPVADTSPEPTNEEPAITSASLSAWQLLGMGFSHIVAAPIQYWNSFVSLFQLKLRFPEGLDHVLFVVSLFLLAPRAKPLLIQVTAFTAAHSVTLALAMAGIVLLPSRLVETLIAASIVVMAVENLFMREAKPWRWMLVFAFGLIHGLGFAGSFSSLRMETGDFLRPLLLLNIGIEIGQLTIVAVCAAVTWWAWKKPWYNRVIVYPSSIAIALLALWWTIERGFALG